MRSHLWDLLLTTFFGLNFYTMYTVTQLSTGFHHDVILHPINMGYEVILDHYLVGSGNTHTGFNVGIL